MSHPRYTLPDRLGAANATPLNRRRFLAGVLGAAGAAVLSGCATPGTTSAPAGAPTPGAGGSGPDGAISGQLTVSSFGGETEQIYNEIVYQRLQEAHGVTVTQVTLQSDDALARLIAQGANPEIDLFQFSGGQESTAKERELTQALDDLGVELPDAFVDPDGHWVSVAVIPEGIVYNTEAIPEPPTSYNDFLNPDYRGHIAFPNITSGYGVDFLVMLAYANGGSEHDIDPGFEALAEIAPHATIFQAAAEMQTLFAQADVWLMPYDSSNAYRTAQAGLPVVFTSPEEGSPANFITHVVATASPNAAAANEAIRTALTPEAQAEMAERLRWLPVNPATELPDDLAEEIPVGADAVDALRVLDRAAIAEQRPEWTERFNREIAT